jgi:hypothetical protein
VQDASNGEERAQQVQMLKTGRKSGYRKNGSFLPSGGFEKRRIVRICLFCLGVEN